MRLPFALALGVLCVLGACVRSKVTKVGSTDYPPKPEGCPVELFTSGAPSYPSKNIASVQATCYSRSRDVCISILRDKTCELGGDTLHGFEDGIQGAFTVVTATVGIKAPAKFAKPTSVPVASSISSPAPSPAPEGCDPPCSPGYECQGSRCLALCNPPCAAGSHCNQQRVCEPDAASTPDPAIAPSVTAPVPSSVPAAAAPAPAASSR
jgi:hypothetical protein